MYYNISKEEVIKKLNSSKEGLTEKEVKKRQKKFGKNNIEKKKPISPLKILLNQFIDPLVIVLIIATIISFLIQHYVDAIVIGIILTLNTLLGFTQEYKAEKAIDMLNELRSYKTKVLRNNKISIIETKELVPGDIIILETGDKIPADARLLETISLNIDESSLTGESTPIFKIISPIKNNLPIADQLNMIFSGTIITEGRCKAIVTNIGQKTELGKIAKSIENIKQESTPLQKRLKQLGKWLTILILAIVILLIPIGLLRNINFFDIFLTSLSLAVAAIPEGLPAVVTITLALGLRKMLKKKALIRKLRSVETLGSVTTICSDKTGTLTQNEMTVTNLYANNKEYKVTGKGYELNGSFLLNNKIIESTELNRLIQISTSCNNATIESGDPTERALKVLAEKGKVKAIKREQEIPFSSEKKYMAIIDSKKTFYVKGAVETILKKCKYIEVNNKKRDLTSQDKEEILNKNKEFTSKALRVLAFAYGEEDALIFVGLAGMIDPPRKEVKSAIQICKQAGIRIIMLTGDHELTAIAIAKQIGIKGGSINGLELDKISDIKLKTLVNKVSIFARISPEHKVRILNALKANKEVVAMTGDGVNDAPALKKADVGIAMNIKGTDISREVSDIILLDDNFASIVSAIKEGRIIYQNIKKFIKFLLASNINEIAIVFFALIVGLPLPVLPIQILWINLVTDSFPALALGIDPAEPGLMKRKPRNPNESIFHNMKGFLIYATIFSFIAIVGLFLYYYKTSTIEHARTIVFTTIICLELFFVVFASRSRTTPLFKLKPNYQLLGAVLLSFLLLIIVVYTPLNQYFYTVPLSIKDWLLILPISLLGLVLYEIGKLFKKTYK
ncbi:MAG: calcium-translocating P-type ATPase, PMCA-type [archaeon]